MKYAVIRFSEIGINLLSKLLFFVVFYELIHKEINHPFKVCKNQFGNIKAR
jgi:hypothetical protein